MTHYTLDYSNPVRPDRRYTPDSRPRRRMYRAYRRILVPLCSSLCAIAAVSLWHQRTETRLLRQRYGAQVVRYDSLLAAKSEADQQLGALQQRLSAQQRAARLRQPTPPR